MSGPLVSGSWNCPDCGRRFGRKGQSHECAPALSLEEYFATGPAHERPIFEAVLAFVETLGPIHVEPVQVGIFLKKTGGFVELRPMQRWVALWFPLARRLEHSRISRKPMRSGQRWYHVVNLGGPGDVDDTIKDWLTESYLGTA